MTGPEDNRPRFRVMADSIEDMQGKPAPKPAAKIHPLDRLDWLVRPLLRPMLFVWHAILIGLACLWLYKALVALSPIWRNGGL